MVGFLGSKTQKSANKGPLRVPYSLLTDRKVPKLSKTGENPNIYVRKDAYKADLWSWLPARDHTKANRAIQ